MLNFGSVVAVGSGDDDDDDTVSVTTLGVVHKLCEQDFGLFLHPLP